jgi:hypothetical protein
MKRKDFLKLAGAATAGCSLVSLESAIAQARESGGGKTRVSVKLLDLKLRHAWGLSRGTWTTRRNAFVRIERDGTVGMGEAAPIARYEESAEGAAAFIEKARPVLDRDLWEYAVRWNEIEALATGQHVAKAAFDIPPRLGREEAQRAPLETPGAQPQRGPDDDLFHRHR